MIQSASPRGAKIRPRTTLTTRQIAVLDDLRKLIAAEGFRHLRVADFAARLGCSTSLLYRLADSRDELVYRTIKNMHQRHDDHMRELDSNQPRLVVLKEAAMVLANMHDPISPQTIEDINAFPHMKHIVDDFDERNLLRIEALIERGIANGEIAPIDPRLAAEIWHGAIMQADNLKIEGREGLTRGEVIGIVADVIAQGLSARPSK